MELLRNRVCTLSATCQAERARNERSLHCALIDQVQEVVDNVQNTPQGSELTNILGDAEIDLLTLGDQAKIGCAQPMQVAHEIHIAEKILGITD